MKKGLLLALATIFGAMNLVGCSRWEQIANAVEYPEEYYIEYSVETEENTIVRIAKGLDGEGNCYYKNAEGEYLFVLEAGAYSVYGKDDEGWVKKNEQVNKKYVEEFTEGFDEYAEKSKEKFNGQYKKGDDVTFLERACNSYTLTLRIVNFKQSYEMYVDAETGVCMQYKGASAVNGETTDENGFVCVEFQTENVDVLSYLNMELI